MIPSFYLDLENEINTVQQASNELTFHMARANDLLPHIHNLKSTIKT